MKAKRRIRTVDERIDNLADALAGHVRSIDDRIEDLRAQVTILAGTVEKLVEVVCASEATECAARKERLTQRLPF